MPAAAAAKPGSTIQRTTFQYATKNGQILSLDRVVDQSVKVQGKRPVIIFSVGGGWVSGSRDDRSAAPFVNYLATLGYTVVSIDYRLGIKEAAAKKEFTPTTAVSMYLRAGNWGVEDLLDATGFVIKNADAWNIDKDRIVIVGNSAGAVNSLTAEFNVANWTDVARARLPEGFRYSGVIAMAGAFWLKADTPLAFKSKPAPILFFHGGKDNLVTYDEVQGPFSGYGPVAFYRKFGGTDYPKWFVDYPQADHIIAAVPMIDQRRTIEDFLQKLVKERQQMSIHTVEEDKEPKTIANFAALYGDRLLTGADASAPAKKAPATN